MNKRNLLVAKLPIANQPENKSVHIELSFRQGGMNLFSHKTQPRGYYLSANVKTVEVSEYGTTSQYMPMNGICQCVEEAPRFSAKRLQSLADEIALDPARYSHLAEHTLTKAGLQAEPAALAH